MNIITLTEENLEGEHICCAIGNDQENRKRAATKKDWLKERFKEGLVFKKIDVRGKVFIEYMPIEKVWKPLVGKNYMVINCLWVSGQYKGKGLSKELLNACIADAKRQGMDGVVAVSSTKVKPFLTDKKFYLKNGFEVADTAPPYFELLILKFNKTSENPSFAEHVKKDLPAAPEGLWVVYANQCPFMEAYVTLLGKVAEKHRLPCVLHQLQSFEEAQNLGSPFGTLSLYWNGKFQTHELMSEKKFEKWIETLKVDEAT